MFAVVASNAEATTQTNGLLPLNFVSVFFGQSMFGTGWFFLFKINFFIIILDCFDVFL
jgi:hypothetical protein